MVELDEKWLLRVDYYSRQLEPSEYGVKLRNELDAAMVAVRLLRWAPGYEREALYPEDAN